jgi:hypothetical protein
VAEAVVDLLQAVEVDHRAGERVRVAVGAGDFLLEPRVEAAEVGQPGEPVRLGQRAEVLLLRGQLERAVDARHQLLGAERLGQVVGRPERQALALRLRVALGREEDDRHLGGLRVAPQPGEGAEAVQSGQEQVEEHQVGQHFLGALHRALAVADCLHVVLIPQQLLQHLARVLVILDHQHERPLPLPRGGERGLGRFLAGGRVDQPALASRGARRTQARSHAPCDFVRAACGVVGPGLDRGRRIGGHHHQRPGRLGQLAHRDGPRQIVRRADERRGRACALVQARPRERLAQGVCDLPRPHYPDVHATAPSADLYRPDDPPAK